MLVMISVLIGDHTQLLRQLYVDHCGAGISSKREKHLRMGERHYEEQQLRYQGGDGVCK